MANEEEKTGTGITEAAAGAVEADKAEVSVGDAGAISKKGMSKLQKALDDRLNRSVREQTTLHNFVEVARAGMSAATEATLNVKLHRRIAKALRKPDPFSGEEEFQKRQEEARKIEHFAREQARRGFPYLFSSAVVRLWTILEALVDDMGLILLCHPDFEWAADTELLKLEGPVLSFLNASREERAEWISGALKDKLGVTRRPGVARFEAFLKPLGLTGKIDDLVKRTLLELSAVRNALVHKNGIVDKRFLDACPWLDYLKPGSEMIVTVNDFQMYYNAAAWYTMEIDIRVEDKYKGERTESAVATQAVFLANLHTFLKIDRRLQLISKA